MTKTEKVIEYLVSKGCTEVPSTSRKYRKFSIPGKDVFYWVGKAGGCRRGKTATGSTSVTSIISERIK